VAELDPASSERMMIGAPSAAGDVSSVGRCGGAVATVSREPVRAIGEPPGRDPQNRA